jgi:hypothetical protein
MKTLKNWTRRAGMAALVVAVVLGPVAAAWAVGGAGAAVVACVIQAWLYL